MPEDRTICQPTPSYEMHEVKQIQTMCTEADVRVRVMLADMDAEPCTAYTPRTFSYVNEAQCCTSAY